MSTQGTGTKERRLTVRDLRARKETGERIVALTAYDYTFARLVDAAGVDLVLVGDSLGDVMLGLDGTVAVTVEQMIHHARAVRAGTEHALVAVDLPFMSYQVSESRALRNAGRMLAQTGVEAVKLEGGSPRIAATVGRLVEAGIPVIGHLGFTPQSVHATGGYRVQARGDEGRAELVEAARRLEDAGAFAIVLELVPGEAAEAVTASVSVPTIGIGAGAACDGQILVLHDMLGMNPGFNPKFLRRFAEVGDAVAEGVRAYSEAVREGSYPAEEHTFR